MNLTVVISVIGPMAYAIYYSKQSNVQYSRFLMIAFMVLISGYLIIRYWYLEKLAKYQFQMKKDQFKEEKEKSEKQEEENQKAKKPNQEFLNKHLRLLEKYPEKSSLDVKIEKQFKNEKLLKMHREQRGNTCGATSVATALSFMMNQSISTIDIMLFYYLHFEDKQSNIIQKLQKINKQLLNIIDSLNQDPNFKYNESLNNLLENPLQKSAAEKLIQNYSMIQNKMRRLHHDGKYSTWPVGNDLLMKAIQFFSKKFTKSDGQENSLKVAPFYGLTCMNSPERPQDFHWDLFKESIEKSVLLYHCDNHYSLIFGYREIEYEGHQFRQVLGSRRGQRAKHWIDFDYSWNMQKNEKTIYKRSVTQCTKKWSGYQVMKIEKGVNRTIKDIQELENILKKWDAYANQPVWTDNAKVEREMSQGEQDKTEDEA